MYLITTAARRRVGDLIRHGGADYRITEVRVTFLSGTPRYKIYGERV